MNHSFRTYVLWAAVFALALLSLSVPKLILCLYYQGSLWQHYRMSDLFQASAQDLLLATVWTGCLGWLMMTSKRLKTKAVLATTALFALFVLLMLDARTRQLWLQPTSWSLLKYLAASHSGLSSGNDFFFKTQAGLGMTFRRLLVAMCFLFAISWSVVLACGILHFRKIDALDGFRKASRKFLLGTALPCGLAFFAIAVWAPPYDYAVQQNIFTHPLVELFRKRISPVANADSSIGQSFAGKSVQAAKTFKGSPRQRLQEVRPFSNVIIVAFESLRWKGMGFEERDSKTAPFLSELARDGMLAKCYVSLPHSSKSEFSMLTGRHPYPGIEMREAMMARHESLFREFKEQVVSGRTYGFSSIFLNFENLRGILQACGIDHIFEAKDLAASTSKQTTNSSFGNDDLWLVKAPAQILQPPFAAFFLPLAAHYPYAYPNKPDGHPADLEAYLRSIQHADATLRQMFQELQDRGLLENTLVVILGDHGESFGEHGSWVHNNSLYEEEITTPLILWSLDKRLKTDTVGVCSELDIAPTALDLLGLVDSKLPVQGRSLLRKSGEEPVYVTSFFHNVSQALILGNKKYLHLSSSRKLLKFDLQADPEERNPIDLSAQKTAEKSEILLQLQAFDAYQKNQFPAETH